MAHAENEIVINRPLSDVYDFLADGLNNLRWRPGIAELNLISGKPDTAGATYRQVFIGPFGRHIDADYRVTKVDRNAELDFEVIAGPIRPIGAFYFGVSGAGTKLKFVLDYRPKGLSILKVPIAEWLMHKEVGNLEMLKEVLERYYPPSTMPPVRRINI
ncbi:MAG TPA: SRPBCC family protein [Candidatus Saccharimonadales bacterium]